MRTALILISLIGFIDGKVSFTYSMLFDEFDLNGNKEAIGLERCITGGCSVFVSASDKAMEATRNIFIQDNNLKTNFSLYDYASGYDRTTGKLKALQLAGTGYFLRNYNDGNIGPIVIYNVASGAPLYQYNRLELFDGLRMNRQDNASSYVTILSAEPYDLFTDSFGSVNQAFVRATGFDNNAQRQPSPDNCQILYDQSATSQPFRLHINSPIITISFDALVKTQICARKNTENVALLDYRGIATSPGYIGCAAVDPNHDTFLSSGYPSANFDLHDSANVDRLIDLDYAITTKGGDKVQFTTYTNGGVPNKFFDQGTNKMVTRKDKAYKITVDLADALGSSYLVRYDPETTGSIPTGEGICSNYVPQTTTSGVSSTTSVPPSTPTTSVSNDLSSLLSIAFSLFLVIVAV